VRWFLVVLATSLAVGFIVIGLSALIAWIRRPPA
jgi:hypothetical protein